MIDKDNGIIAGHGELWLLKKLGLKEVPVLQIVAFKRNTKTRLYIADNRLALDAGGMMKCFGVEFAELADDGFNLELTGFDLVGD